MNVTELESLMFPFDPRTNNVLFYGSTMAYCATGFYNILVISSRILKRCIPKHESKEVPFAKLTNVIVEQPAKQSEEATKARRRPQGGSNQREQKEHEITPE